MIFLTMLLTIFLITKNPPVPNIGTGEAVSRDIPLILFLRKVLQIKI